MTTSPIIDTYVLIPDDTGERVLGERTNDGWQLPYVPEAERFWSMVGRIAPFLKERTGLDLTVLRWLTREYDESTKTARRLFALENHSPNEPLPEGFGWLPLSALAGLAPALHLKAAQAHLTELGSGAMPARRAPWAQPGWYADMRRWVAAQLAARGDQLVGLAQVKTWFITSVWRVEGATDSYYFKATPPIFHRESKVTTGLAAAYPDLMPEVVGVVPEQGWLLMRSFPPGTSLGKTEDLALWERALTLYAQLQQAYIDRKAELLSWGCLDRSPASLMGDVDQLVAVLDQVEGLDEVEAATFMAAVPRLKTMCAELAGLGIPSTLEHGDLHAGNIHVNGERFIFYDWTDASISHPFFSLITFLYRFEEQPDIANRLRSVYLSAWQEWADEAVLERAIQLALPLSALHQAISYAVIINPSCENSSEWGGDAAEYIRLVLKYL